MALAHRVRTALLEPVVRPRPCRVAAPRVRWGSPPPCSAGASYRRSALYQRPQVQGSRLGVAGIYVLAESTLGLARLRVSERGVKQRDALAQRRHGREQRLHGRHQGARLGPAWLGLGLGLGLG